MHSTAPEKKQVNCRKQQNIEKEKKLDNCCYLNLNLEWFFNWTVKRFKIAVLDIIHVWPQGMFASNIPPLSGYIFLKFYFALRNNSMAG